MFQLVVSKTKDLRHKLGKQSWNVTKQQKREICILMNNLRSIYTHPFRISAVSIPCPFSISDNQLLIYTHPLLVRYYQWIKMTYFKDDKLAIIAIAVDEKNNQLKKWKWIQNDFYLIQESKNVVENRTVKVIVIFVLFNVQMCY